LSKPKNLVTHNDTKKMGQILSQWDYLDDIDKAAPTLFQSIYRKFFLLVFQDELGEDLARTMLDKWFGSRLGHDPTKWMWGKVHQLEFVSPIRRKGFGKGLLGGGSHPFLGSGETLCCGMYDFNDPFNVTISASLRMVADLGDDDKVLAVLPGGVSGRLFDPHTKDQIKAFIHGNKVYWWFSDTAIQEHSKTTLVLSPQ